MPRPKKTTLKYTVSGVPGLTLEVPGTQDTDVAREQALQQALDRMNDPDENILDKNSFPDGLNKEDLILVPPIASPSKDKELHPVQLAAQIAAQYAEIRVALQESQELVKEEYLPLLKALLEPKNLTPEQMAKAKDKKSLLKAVDQLAENWVVYEDLASKAETAINLLAEVASGKKPTFLAEGEEEIAPETASASEKKNGASGKPQGSKTAV